MKLTSVCAPSGQADGLSEAGLSSGEPEQREDPQGSVNGKPETDDKENNNGLGSEETQAGRWDSDD